MTDEVETGIARARRELDATKWLVDGGFAETAASRACYAAFHAAEAALLLLGEVRSKHSGVISAFDRLVVEDGGLGREDGRLLRRLFEGRGEADHGRGASPEEAAAARDAAERFVAAVEAWISSRG